MVAEVAFGNYWGSPFSEISGLSDDYFTKNGNPWSTMVMLVLLTQRN